MALQLISIGNKPPEWVQDGCADYARRFPRQWRFSERHLNQSRAQDVSTRRADEARRLLAEVPDNAVLIALDERGKQFDSAGFAKALQKQLEQGKPVILAIGGPHGHDLPVIDRADALWSLSTLTLPHPLARLVLHEQLYRAHARFQGHPYHSA